MVEWRVAVGETESKNNPNSSWSLKNAWQKKERVNEKNAKRSQRNKYREKYGLTGREKMVGGGAGAGGS